MTAPGDGELISPKGTFEHALQVTTGFGPSLQSILDTGAAPGNGWFIMATGNIAPGVEQAGGVSGVTGFSYQAWGTSYVSVNRNSSALSTWDDGVTEIDGMSGGLAAADLGRIDVNLLLNTKAVVERYVRWLETNHDTLVHWAERVGAADSRFGGLGAHVLINRLLRLSQIVNNVNKRLTADRSPPVSESLQQTADALVTFGREMSSLWNHYSRLLYGAVEHAMDAVVNNIYRYIVEMGLDRAHSPPYILGQLAGDGREPAEAYIRSVIAGYHSDASSAPDFSHGVAAVVSANGETRSFEPGKLPDGMVPFGGPLDSPATWDLINTRVSDYVRQLMAPMNTRATELLGNLADAYHRAEPALTGSAGSGNVTGSAPPGNRRPVLNADPRGDNVVGLDPSAADVGTNGPGGDSTTTPPPDGWSSGGHAAAQPPVDHNGTVDPGGYDRTNTATPVGDHGNSGSPNGSFSGIGVLGLGDLGSNGAQFDPNGSENSPFGPAPFMPLPGSPGPGGARWGNAPRASPRSRTRDADDTSDDDPVGSAGRSSITLDLDDDGPYPGDPDFRNVAPDSPEGIAKAAVGHADDALGNEPGGSVSVPGLTDNNGIGDGGDFGALSDRVLHGASDLSEAEFPGGGLDGALLGDGAGGTSAAAFDGQGWSDWSDDDLPEQDSGARPADPGGEHRRHMPMMPIMPPRAGRGESEERQRLTWLAEDAGSWGTRSEVGIGVVGLPADIMREPEERLVPVHVHAPEAPPRETSTGGAIPTKQEYHTGSDNQR